jgi:hypothetical protein
MGGAQAAGFSKQPLYLAIHPYRYIAQFSNSGQNSWFVFIGIFQIVQTK